jgi:trimeric autotransporter adhesin
MASFSGIALLCLMTSTVYGVSERWNLPALCVTTVPSKLMKLGLFALQSAASQLRRQLTFKGAVTALQLYNADKDTKILDLVNGAVVNLTSIPGMNKPSFNINAAFNDTVRSTVFSYNGAKYRTDGIAPYAFCGNDGSNFFSCDKLGCGIHTVSAVPYSGDAGQGEAGKAFTATFTIVCPPPSPGKITGLGLINADKDTKILDLANGTVVNVKSIAGMTRPSFNIDASYIGAVESVVYGYNGTKYLLEVMKPYAFCGNDRTNFFSCDKLKCGTHTVTATPYALGAGQGPAGTPLTVTFSVVC